MKEFFSTSDLAITTALSVYFPISSINKDNPRKAEFIFERSKEFDDLVNRYWNRELLVEPRQYFYQLKAIKARLYGSE